MQIQYFKAEEFTATENGAKLEIRKANKGDCLMQVFLQNEDNSYTPVGVGLIEYEEIIVIEVGKSQFNGKIIIMQKPIV